MIAGRILALMLAIATMGLMVGTAAAVVVFPGPTPVPTTQVVTYTISVPGNGAPAMVTPYYTWVQPGLVSIHFLNHDGMQHAYVLRGIGLYVPIAPMGAITMFVFLNHPGQYAWTNVIPTPGVPSGATVAVLTVV